MHFTFESAVDKSRKGDTQKVAGIIKINNWLEELAKIHERITDEVLVPMDKEDDNIENAAHYYSVFAQVHADAKRCIEGNNIPLVVKTKINRLSSRMDDRKYEKKTFSHIKEMCSVLASDIEYCLEKYEDHIEFANQNNNEHYSVPVIIPEDYKDCINEDSSIKVHRLAALVCDISPTGNRGKDQIYLDTLYNRNTEIGRIFDKLRFAVNNGKINIVEKRSCEDTHTINIAEGIEWLEEQPGVIVSEKLKEHVVNKYLVRNLEVNSSEPLEKNLIDQSDEEKKKKPVLEIKYIHHSRQVILHNLVTQKERILITFQHGSEGHLVFEYLFNNTDTNFSTGDLVTLIPNYQLSMHDHYSKMLNKIGFKHNIGKIFFPETKQDSIKFVNNITAKLLKELSIDVNNIK